MRSLLIRCYPASWRARYGDEFAAILEERPLGPFDVADIILGALDAQLRLRGRAVPNGKGLPMSLRIGGIAAIAGAILWATGTIMGFIGQADLYGASLLFLAGWLSLLVALVGLSAFQARAHPLLTWTAFALPAVGTIVGIAGIAGMHLGSFGVGFTYWSLWNLTAVPGLGFALFAIVTYSTAALSQRASVLLALGSVLPLVVFAGQLPEWVLVAGLILVACGWLALGVQAIRLDRPVAVERPV